MQRSGVELEYFGNKLNFVLDHTPRKIRKPRFSDFSSFGLCWTFFKKVQLLGGGLTFKLTCAYNVAGWACEFSELILRKTFRRVRRFIKRYSRLLEPQKGRYAKDHAS